MPAAHSRAKDVRQLTVHRATYTRQNRPNACSCFSEETRRRFNLLEELALRWSSERRGTSALNGLASLPAFSSQFRGPEGAHDNSPAR